MLWCHDGGQMRLDNVIYIRELNLNILSLGNSMNMGVEY